MKKAKSILYAIVAFMMMSFKSFSQKKASSFSALLAKYYDVKSALVNSDATTASKSANDLFTLVKTVGVKTLAANEQTVFQLIRGKLEVAVTKDLAKQRAAFNCIYKLSHNDLFTAG